MLLENLYKINKKEATESGTAFYIELNPEHEIYKGHFPGQPVLPGVCSLQIIKECAQEILGTELQYSQMGSCKFNSSIDPVRNNKIQLNISLKPKEDDGFQLQVEGMYGENPFIKIKAQMKTAKN
jgi:3-hydroxyacyl-[acyl-carrier-protein] dehydratase